MTPSAPALYPVSMGTNGFVTSAAHRHLSRDPVMRRLIRAHGPCALAPLRWSPYEALTRAIAHQQLNGRAAESILARFIALFANGRFPSPADVSAARAARLRRAGFSRGKVRAIKDIARHALAGAVPTRRAAARLDDEAIIERLTRIHGVGRWTVEMLLIFTLGRPDVLPVDDFGVREGYRLAYGRRERPTPKALRAVGERWKPYRSAAAWYLWRAAGEARKKVLLGALIVAMWSGVVAAQGQPEGQLTIAFDASIAPTFLDPAETPGIGTPFVFLFAMHDALVKPLPGNDMAPCLAESWKESPDGLTYEFKLRPGLKFHNGDPFTAEDVKFTFLRYKGASAKLLHERVKSVDVLDPLRVRFVLDKPWPDFLLFYATMATGAAWIVPQKYIEKVGEEGFRRQPVGLGPYRFVRQTPGVELVLEANEQYWRKKPSIKTLVFKGVPDRTTRLAMLKTGEADIGYLMVGVEAATIKADSKLRLLRAIPPATWWLDYPEQFNPKSPWHDRRVRLAATMAVDTRALNEAERLGYSRLTGSIIPSAMDFALRLEPYPYDPTHARRLLVEAGYPNGFDAGEVTPFPPFVTMGESVASYLGAVGIRSRVRSMERATFMEAWRTKTRSGVFVTVTAAPGNAASRIENFVISTAPYATGGHPDIDDLFRQQAQERDRKKREPLLHQIQRLMYDRVMYGGIFEPATLHGIGPRVEEAGVGLSPQLYFTSPWEDMRLKKP